MTMMPFRMCNFLTNPQLHNSTTDLTQLHNIPYVPNKPPFNLCVSRSDTEVSARGQGGGWKDGLGQWGSRRSWIGMDWEGVVDSNWVYGYGGDGGYDADGRGDEEDESPSG